MERQYNCETCRHNQGIFCTGEACKDHDQWEQKKQPPKRCSFCGGELSRLRTDGKRYWRHCFGCFHEVPADELETYDLGELP